MRLSLHGTATFRSTSTFATTQRRQNFRTLHSQGKPNELTWSSGALDGVFGHHMASTKPEEISRRVQKLLTVLTRLLREATDKNFSRCVTQSFENPFFRSRTHFSQNCLRLYLLTKRRSRRLADTSPPVQTAGRQPSLESCCWKSLETELTHFSWKRWHSTTNSPCSQHSRWPMSPMILRKHCGALRDGFTVGVEYKSSSA